MRDETIVALIPFVSAFVALFFVPLGLLWWYVVREWLLIRWVTSRLRIARNVHRAAYIRWWREH